MELLFATVIICLAVAGAALGLAFGRAPVRTSCSASEELSVGRCADCPLRKRAQARTTP